jgi:hypothetical protein
MSVEAMTSTSSHHADLTGCQEWYHFAEALSPGLPVDELPRCTRMTGDLVISGGCGDCRAFSLRGAENGSQ